MAQFNSVAAFGQATAVFFQGDNQIISARTDQDVQLSQEQYLDAVLSGTSPMDMVDHGIGPFMDNTTYFQPSDFGVICIANIPYNVTKSEIIHFLGRNASMIAHNEQGCAIHIIMERPTSKTMDCYVELLTTEAAADAFQKHENMVLSGKHPRIGTRHVDVTISSQDELLAAIFPRARGLVWENGVPHKIENNDPYSAGFQGFFTREEMIGMFRHAEAPQRSPFSVKCLQRTFECMISTLYKFPWHAQHMYTIEDRTQLFNCYMQQLEILTSKVAEAQTVGLDTKLLIDFVSAGLNCAGFGERMRYMIAASSGQIGASFPVHRKSAAWPFDVLAVPFSSPDGGRWWFEHEKTLELLMYLIDLGHEVCGNNYIHSEWIKILPPSPPSDFDQQDVTSVRYKFREEVCDISYDETVSCEAELMRQMLEAGFTKWGSDMRSAWNDGRFNRDMQRDLDCLARLQQFNRLYGATEHLSPSESPKGTTAIPAEEGRHSIDPITGYSVHSDNNAAFANAADTPRPSNIIDPTVDPFEPFARRNSEPALASPHVTIVAPVRSESSRDLPTSVLTPRARPSSALEIRHPDDSVASSPPGQSPSTQSPIGGHRPSNAGRSPLRPRHKRGAFSVGQTIHEENEDDGDEEVITMIGRPRRSTNAGF